MRVSHIESKTTVSVISDSRLFRETISSWLDRHNDIQCVAAAGSLQHLRQQAATPASQVIVVRAPIDGMLGRELTYETRTLLPSARLIVVQSHDSQHDLVRWIEAGAVDYLHHDVSPAELLQCIREAARGCPQCSMSRHTRVIRASGEATYRAAYSGENPVAAPVAAVPVAVGELDAAVRPNSDAKFKKIPGHRGKNVASSYDLSKVPVQ
jgi:DNA-binding NarL/FixJ family response regulator